MVRAAREHVGGDAVQAATGKTHDEWHAVLHEAGAKDWSHKEIAAYLVEEHAVDGWWAQGITVDYEQKVKGRLPGQRPDGTFECAVRRTIPGGQLEALELVVEKVVAEYGQPRARSMTLRTPNVRFAPESGIRIVVDAQPTKPSGTPVGITVSKLPDQDAHGAVKRWATETLESLR